MLPNLAHTSAQSVSKSVSDALYRNPVSVSLTAHNLCAASASNAAALHGVSAQWKMYLPPTPFHLGDVATSTEQYDPCCGVFCMVIKRGAITVFAALMLHDICFVTSVRTQPGCTALAVTAEPFAHSLREERLLKLGEYEVFRLVVPALQFFYEQYVCQLRLSI